MGSSVFGREAELDAVERFLDATEQSHPPSVALVIEGHPGIGKSAIWREAISRADRRGIRILSSRPAEAEARLSYSGLADLVGPAYDEVRDDLHPPQQRALDVALLRTLAQRRTDPRTTGTGLVSVLHALVTSSPVILAIDDTQWLDRASLRANTLVAARIDGSIDVLATAADGLNQPSAVTFGTGARGHQTLFVVNFAVFSPAPTPGVLQVRVGVPESRSPSGPQRDA